MALAWSWYASWILPCGQAGSWIARFRPAGKKTGGYQKKRLATADDIRDPDAVEVLSFSQAQEKARAWFAEAERSAQDPDGCAIGPYTIAEVCADYLDWFTNHRKSVRETKRMIDQSILPRLGSTDAKILSTKQIRAWHESLASVQRGTRRGPNTESAKDLPADEQRARRATANRHLTVLKAALNHAYREGRLPSDSAWRRAQPFAGVYASRVRWLSEGECRRLLNAATSGLRTLIRAALMTGARYSELTRMTASDFDADAGTLFVNESKSGKSRYVPLDQNTRIFLESITAGRSNDALLFLRDDGSQWSRGDQRRPLLDACTNARIDPPASFHVLRHTYASQRLMKGAPLIVIAQALGHSDTRMVEKHYGHLAKGYVQQVIEATGLDLGNNIDDASPVTRIRHG